ncbi:MAG: hypothetical protein R3E89_17255 [Thiolinea sp.]
MESVLNPARLSRLPVASSALFIGGLLWIAAFWLPVFITAQNSVPGYWVFATGWMGFTFFQFAWYANLLILLGVMLMYTYPLRATLIAGLAVLVATQAFWFDVIPGGGAQSQAIVQQGSGFWLWYASILLMGAGVVFGSDHVEPDSIRTEMTSTPTSVRGKKVEPGMQQTAAPVQVSSIHAVSTGLSMPPAPEADLVLADMQATPRVPGETAPALARPGEQVPASARLSTPLFGAGWPENPGLVVAPHIPSIPAALDEVEEDDGEIQFFTGRKKV